ncbi:PhzF family phenazine biosynthesis protein [Photobacterium proteolyticum]|uniref:PhzF family phenazine biosynthesis protein n=1 Tax=Photobacterium proteolyticum TaxID=1903952 RepID=UPI001FE9CB02|nr:PhzF family phenazine biosynthesis protein [Photobacterium proteolyticum]
MGRLFPESLLRGRFRLASFGLSETAFVSQSDVADFKLAFFTPNRRIAHCGHATIATFSCLTQPDFSRANYRECPGQRAHGRSLWQSNRADGYYSLASTFTQSVCSKQTDCVLRPFIRSRLGCF